MKISKWFCIPVFALSLSLVGCGGGDDVTVLEGTGVSEEEQAAEDIDYDSQYESEYESYDDSESQGE